MILNLLECLNSLAVLSFFHQDHCCVVLLIKDRRFAYRNSLHAVLISIEAPVQLDGLGIITILLQCQCVLIYSFHAGQFLIPFDLGPAALFVLDFLDLIVASTETGQAILEECQAAIDLFRLLQLLERTVKVTIRGRRNIDHARCFIGTAFIVLGHLPAVLEITQVNEGIHSHLVQAKVFRCRNGFAIHGHLRCIGISAQRIELSGSTHIVALHHHQLALRIHFLQGGGSRLCACA